MDYEKFKTRIKDRIEELTVRRRDIEKDLDQVLPSDLADQAIELEDDEMLEALGKAAEREIVLLSNALGLMEKNEYGICQRCGMDISPARLEAVLYAVLCRKCAAGQTA